MKYNEIIVTNSLPKEKIYSYLKRNGYSENYVKNLRKKEGYILLNEQIAHSDFVIQNGDILKLCQSPNTKTSIMQIDMPLDIVYEDDGVLIVNKPSGLCTSPSKSHYIQNISGAVLSYMIKKDENFVVRIVGRLDKETAGLVIVAKHSLSANFYSNVNIIKTYYAIVTGKIDNDIVIDKNIATTTNEYGYNNLKREISSDGKCAITYVYPLCFDGENTLCKINIKYGRTHQIRVHLASIGHALLGDNVYGTPSNKISHTALICKELELPIYSDIGKNIDENKFDKKIHLEIDFPDDFKNAFNMCLNNI